MRRIGTVVLTVAAASAVSLATAVAAGVPEIDNANVTIRLTAKPAFTVTQCAGEDGLSYLTYRGAWSGTETDVTPGSTDYTLSGVLKVKNVVWTINTQTQRGVLTGTAALSGPAGTTTGPVYAGPLKLITQGVPSAAGGVAMARGWLAAATYTAGAVDGGSVLANVEFKIAPGFAATGVFGDAPANLGTKDYAVATVNQTC
jgi:hypothetical protein